MRLEKFFCFCILMKPINNFGARYANGEALLFLNNDTEVITQDWIQEMLMHALRKEIGCGFLKDQGSNLV